MVEYVEGGGGIEFDEEEGKFGSEGRWSLIKFSQFWVVLYGTCTI